MNEKYCWGGGGGGGVKLRLTPNQITKLKKKINEKYWKKFMSVQKLGLSTVETTQDKFQSLLQKNIKKQQTKTNNKQGCNAISDSCL